MTPIGPIPCRGRLLLRCLRCAGPVCDQALVATGAVVLIAIASPTGCDASPKCAKGPAFASVVEPGAGTFVCERAHRYCLISDVRNE